MQEWIQNRTGPYPVFSSRIAKLEIRGVGDLGFKAECGPWSQPLPLQALPPVSFVVSLLSWLGFLWYFWVGF